jgi:hypothetical protein
VSAQAGRGGGAKGRGGGRAVMDEQGARTSGEAHDLLLFAGDASEAVQLKTEHFDGIWWA